MAAADYRLCDLCERKTIYDVEVVYSDRRGRDLCQLPERVGDWAVLCEECAKTHKVVIEKHPEEST